MRRRSIKMTLFEKRRQLVVTDANSCIIWLVGIRIDARYQVEDQTTEVFSISFIR